MLVHVVLDTLHFVQFPALKGAVDTGRVDTSELWTPERPGRVLRTVEWSDLGLSWGQDRMQLETPECTLHAVFFDPAD